ncbi:MAG: sulfur transfer protein involved in thiamine biosynthesis [Phycisphaerae bacterium SG8_4]|nr:MAG: sulfur transfer protein involved in thiamine biosynthesis [Phycisphaerae bacterium SG8_4]
MNLVVNGKNTDISDSMTVTELLAKEDVKMPQMVSVELNGQILKRSEFETTRLKDDDKVEFLYYMGGGTCL